MLVGLILIAAVAYAFDVATNQGKIPRGTTVGGVDISAMERPAAVEKLRSELGGVETKPVAVTAGEQASQLVPADSGLQVDFEQAVAGIEDASLNPFVRLASFFTPATEYPVAVQVDESALAPQLERVRAELSVAPTDGMLAIENAEFVVTDPILGQTVDPGQLRTGIEEHWLDPDGVDVEPQVVEPAINDAVIEEMRTGQAATALGKDIVVRGERNATATLDRGAIAQFVHIANEDGRLVLHVDTPRAQEMLAEQLAESEIPAKNATLSFAGGSRQVTESTDGRVVDWDKTMHDFEKRVRSKEDRDFVADYMDKPATFTTEMAQTATFDQVVGEFTTSGYSAASGRNIQLTAQTVNGAIVGPGETFSLNGYTGPRGTAQGYVESGIIINGHSGTAVGGGISQFATTLYNAAYFAGMDDTAHTPHSYYISRYPAGREATVYEGAIDLQFTNSSPHPVRIETDFGGGSITVRLMGVKTVNVTSQNNGRWNTTQPQPMSVSGAGCSPSGGAPGFTTSDTRTISDLSGNVLRQETTTTVYDPQPIVRCS